MIISEIKLKYQTYMGMFVSKCVCLKELKELGFSLYM